MKKVLSALALLVSMSCGRKEVSSSYLKDTQFEGLLSGQKVSYNETRIDLLKTFTETNFRIGNFPAGDVSKGLLSWSVHPHNLLFQAIEVDKSGTSQDSGPVFRVPFGDGSPNGVTIPAVQMNYSIALLPKASFPGGKWTFNISVYVARQRFLESQYSFGSHTMYGFLCANAQGQEIFIENKTLSNQYRATNNAWESEKIDIILDNWTSSQCKSDLKFRFGGAQRGFQFLKMKVQMLSAQ